MKYPDCGGQMLPHGKLVHKCGTCAFSRIFFDYPCDGCGACGKEGK